MLLSLILILIITAGGLALTYLVTEDEPLMWRLAVGCVVGSAVCGTAAFVLGLMFGLSVATAVASVAAAALPLVLFRDPVHRKRLRMDWRRALGKLEGGSPKRLKTFSFYAFFFILFCIFFSWAMYETPAGIFTGGSQNLGDLPFHLGAIYSFTDGNNFPPQNPSFAGARFSYPFVADLLTAVFIKLGADIRNAMFVQNVAWAFSLLVVLERFVLRLTRDRLAGKLAVPILFFSGGLGFLWVGYDYWHQEKGLWDFIWALPYDTTINNNFRWGNSLVTLFITQRSLLLGMPLTLAVLEKLWMIFTGEGTETAEHFRRGLLPSLLTGLIAGTLPLIHLHSLAVLFVVVLCLFIFRPQRFAEWLAFGIGVAVIAVPELLWSVSGTASRPSEFIDWHFGWDHGDTNVLWFWLKNTGLFLPLLIAGFFLISRQVKHETDEHRSDVRSLVFFYVPFALCFVISNVVKLAPWEWDNIKVLIYWFAGSIPFVAYVLSVIWRSGRIGKAIGIVVLAVLVMSGALDVWKTVSGQVKTQVFSKDEVAIAKLIRQKTEPDALFLNPPTYNTAVALTGRPSLMRYPGHLSSHGIDYQQRENDVKQIYQGGPMADSLLDKYGIKYVLVSPEELNTLNANMAYFSRFPVVAEAGQAKVFKVR